MEVYLKDNNIKTVNNNNGVQLPKVNENKKFEPSTFP